MKVLVTGASGLVGSHLCKRLVDEGYPVIGLVHTRISPIIQSLMNCNNFNLCNADIRDAVVINDIIKANKIESLFHLAAHLPYTVDGDIDGVNIQGTSNLLHSAFDNGVEDVVFASSISVYLSPPSILPITEEHPVCPLDIYGVSKIEGEKLCDIYNKYMRTVKLRFAGVYGMGDIRVVNKFFNAALRNEPLTVFGNGHQSCEYVYVDDVVEGLLLAWKKQAAGVFNIGSGQETFTIDLARQIVELTKSNSKIVFSDGETDRPFRFYLDINKAKQELGYNPRRLSQGLKEYWENMNGKV